MIPTRVEKATKKQREIELEEIAAKPSRDLQKFFSFIGRKQPMLIFFGRKMTLSS